MDVAVILSTYNSPQALRMSLLGFAAQTFTDFQLLVADDGSDNRTAEVLNENPFANLKITHVWQPDDGFRLSAIRNAAIKQTQAEYLIFCDGDCIPRNDFVENHIRQSRYKTFVAGGRIDVPAAVHSQFTDQQIVSNQVFSPCFLGDKSPSLKRYRYRLQAGKKTQSILNVLTWRYCVFSGSNAAAWRSDLIAVNGFDEAFPGYGSEDRDIGVRLRNNGVKSKYLKYSLVQLHLEHPKTNLDLTICRQNRAVFRRRMRDGTTHVPAGISHRG
jgi:glycosyltransferase involved in cell wall biosynthesis